MLQLRKIKSAARNSGGDIFFIIGFIIWRILMFLLHKNLGRFIRTIISEEIWSAPGDRYFYSFIVEISMLEEPGSRPNGSAVCIFIWRH
jgi:hypothetical protein